MMRDLERQIDAILADGRQAHQGAVLRALTTALYILARETSGLANAIADPPTAVRLQSLADQMDTLHQSIARMDAFGR